MDEIQQVPPEETVKVYPFQIGLALCIRDQAQFIHLGLDSKAFNQKTLDEEVDKLCEYVKALKRATKQ